MNVNNFGSPFPQASRIATGVESVLTSAKIKVNTDKTTTKIKASGYYFSTILTKGLDKLLKNLSFSDDIMFI